MGGETAYNSNVYSTQSGEEDDYSFRIKPRASLEDHEGELQWTLNYWPSYDYFIDVREKRGWTHRVDGKASWQINPTTRLEVTDRFGRFRSLSRFNEVVTLGEGDEVVDVTQTAFRTERNIRNTAGVSLSHRLTPSRTLIFELGHNLVDFSREDRSDRQTVHSTARYQQVVTRRNTLGGGVSFRRSSFDAGSTGRSQSTDFYNVFGSWQFKFDDTLTLSVAAGPTWVKGDHRDNIVTTAENQLVFPLVRVEGATRLVAASSCPTDGGTLILTGDCDLIDQDLTEEEVSAVRLLGTDLELEGPVPSRSNSTLTYFANIALEKRWEQWSGVLSYRRQQSDSSGLGSSTVADVVSGVLQWRPSPRWHSTLRVALTRQAQATQGVQTVKTVTPTDIFIASSAGVRTFRDVAMATGLRAVEIDQKADALTLWLNLEVRYRLTKRTRLVAGLIYWDQHSASVVGRDFQSYRVHFGVDYEFDPIRL